MRHFNFKLIFNSPNVYVALHVFFKAEGKFLQDLLDSDS